MHVYVVPAFASLVKDAGFADLFTFVLGGKSLRGAGKSVITKVSPV
jgi:hypothetical protein